MSADRYECKTGLDRKCPLCGAPRTRFVDVCSDGDEVIERGFFSQQCSSCGTPCKVWDQIEELKKHNGEMFD